jgi:hypothetical protein
LPTKTYKKLQEDRDCAVHHQGTPIQREANTLVKELAQLAVGNVSIRQHHKPRSGPVNKFSIMR